MHSCHFINIAITMTLLPGEEADTVEAGE